MKTRFSTVDIVASIRELRCLCGLRVVNVYDIDNKTYILKLSSKERKAILMLESGTRIHTTDFEWPKNPAPSGFTMKLRKHIHNRRLETIEQVGVDRIVDLQFGSKEAAYHIILELYDKGNIVLTDYQYTILNILRPRTEGDDVKFIVRETYPVDNAQQSQAPITADRLKEIFAGAKSGDNLKRVLNPHLIFGAALIDHMLLNAGFANNVKIGKGFNVDEDVPRVLKAIEEAEKIMSSVRNEEQKGYIIQKQEQRPGEGGTMLEHFVYQEFHPILFKQFENSSFVEFPSYCKAIDEFFSKMEGQKIDMKAIQQEKDALKKLDNVKKDHEKRLNQLEKTQEGDRRKAELIEMNLEFVDRAIVVVQSAIANQISWKEIEALVKEGQAQGNDVAQAIIKLHLHINHMSLLLSDPYAILDRDENAGEGDDEENDYCKPCVVDIDLDLTAYANAKKYYDKKRYAAKKEQKTIESSKKAFKSAEKKTKQALKDVATVTSIKKARKVHWFEKFYWFISSENFLVIGGRDQQQNELIVKRHLRAGDIYVHADLHGASSIVIKNLTGRPVPPKTLTEAGTMSMCYSVAWDAKVVTNAWWVYHDQVSKTAPSGEYLTTGSFMVRGKKNYLPPCHLIMGFGILFKLDDESVAAHRDERRVRQANDGLEDDARSSTVAENEEVDVEVDLGGESGSDDEETPAVAETQSVQVQSVVDTIATTTDVVGRVEERRATDRCSTSTVDTEDFEHVDTRELRDDSPELLDEQVEKIAALQIDNNEGDADSGSSDDDFDSLYPDTQIALEHVDGDQYLMRHRTTSTATSDSTEEVLLRDDPLLEQSVVFLGDDKPVALKPSLKKVGGGGGKKPPVKKTVSIESSKKSVEGDASQTSAQPAKLKRGQKYKLKKIKEKYKDQDEDDRRLALQLIEGSRAPKEKKIKRAAKASKREAARNQTPKQKPPPSRIESTITVDGSDTTYVDGGGGGRGPLGPSPNVVATTTTKTDPEDGRDAASDEEREEKLTAQEDVALFESLTGVPLPDDVLLYAIPMCAPYNSIMSYKFKVKLVPGTGKRGKAAKTALAMYQHDRTATPREKDLVKSLKDQDISRYMPGKVKMSAPQLQKIKKHK